MFSANRKRRDGAHGGRAGAYRRYDEIELCTMHVVRETMVFIQLLQTVQHRRESVLMIDLMYCL